MKIKTLLLNLYYYFRKAFCRKHNYFIYKYDVDKSAFNVLSNGIDPKSLLTGVYMNNKTAKSILESSTILFVKDFDVEEYYFDILTTKNLLDIVESNCLYSFKVATLLLQHIRSRYGGRHGGKYAIYNLSDKIDNKFLTLNDKNTSSKDLTVDIFKLKDLVDKEDYTTLIPEASLENIIDKLGFSVATSQVMVDYNKINIKDIKYPVGKLNVMDTKLMDLINNKQPFILAELLWLLHILMLYDGEHYSYFLNLPFMSLDSKINENIDFNALRQTASNLIDGLFFRQLIERQHIRIEDICLLLDTIRNYYLKKLNTK